MFILHPQVYWETIVLLQLWWLIPWYLWILATILLSHHLLDIALPELPSQERKDTLLHSIAIRFCHSIPAWIHLPQRGLLHHNSLKCIEHQFFMSYNNLKANSLPFWSFVNLVLRFPRIFSNTRWEKRCFKLVILRKEDVPMIAPSGRSFNSLPACFSAKITTSPLGILCWIKLFNIR